MTLTDMVDVITADTGRVDKAAAIRRAVNRAIIQVHSAGWFHRDIQSSAIAIASAAEPNVFTSTLPDRTRKIVTALPLDVAGLHIPISTNDNRYRYVEPEHVVDGFFKQLLDAYYVSGDKITISSTVSPDTLFLGYYEQPDVATDALETWLMKAHAEIFIDTALSIFYVTTGRDDVAKSLRTQLFTFDYPMLIGSYSTDGEI